MTNLDDSPLVTGGTLPDFTEGQSLAGIYLLRRKIDSGSGDSIWLAFDEVLGKNVSLHFVPPLVSDDALAMEALRHEIKRARQLIHPNILRVLDLVEEPGSAAISMDAFEAESVATMLRKSKTGFLEPVEVRAWFQQLCQTLQDTHKIQLLHRNLSLRSLFVEASGKLLITGFGISRTLQDALNRLQPVGEVDPGVAYMSPQQLDGKRPSVADDIYAMGALLHEILAGEPPFVGSDIIRQIRRKAPASITERRRRKINTAAAISPEWERVAAACLEKNPEQRPKTADEIESVLNRSKMPDNVTAMPVRSVGTPLRGVDKLRPAQVPIPLQAEPFQNRTEAKKTDTSRVKPAELLAAKVKLATEAKEVTQQAPMLGPVDPTSYRTKIATEKPDDDRPPPAFKADGSTKIESTASALENAIPDHYPSFGPRRASFPIVWITAAATLLAIGVYGVFFVHQPATEKTPGNPVFAAEETDGGFELTAVNNAVESELETDVTRNSANSDQATLIQRDAGRDPASVFAEETLTAANAVPRVETSIGSAPANSSAPAAVATDASITAKMAALEKAQQAAQAAELARQEMMKQQKEAEAGVGEARKSLEAKTKAAAPIIKAAQEIESARKKRQEEIRAAELEAQKAQLTAVEKARAADDAKKSLAAFETENKEKLAAQQKADAELKDLQKQIENKQRIAAEALKAAEEAGSRIAERNAAIKKSEQELADARLAMQKAAEEAARQAAQRRRNLESELEATRRLFKEKMEALEKALQESQPLAVPPAASVPATKPAGASTAGIERDPAAEPSPAPPSPVKAPAMDTTLAMKTEPPRPGAPPTPASAVKKTGVAQGGFQNSLGMRFASVGDVLFSVWQTRVQDFEVFAKETGLKSNLWKDPGFKQGLTHPVVNVSWTEAVAFCKWLTVKEQKEGLIAANQSYRLPYDLEWSRAVGLSDEVGKTPEERDMGVADVFPWGRQWPPPAGAGNYTGEETGSDVAIKGYDDGYAWTSPVGSFPPNKLGLYDMGGNVWQWCMDSWNREQKAKALRGGSWYNGAIKFSLLSSCRVQSAPDSSTDNYGFRCVIATGEPGRSRRR